MIQGINYLDPILNEMAENPRLTKMEPIARMARIDDKDVHQVLLGTLKPETRHTFWGNEISNRLRKLVGKSVDEVQPIQIRDKIIEAAPSKVIQENVNQPFTLYKADHSAAGYHEPHTGKSYLNITTELNSAEHHEGVRHATDQIIEHYGLDKLYQSYLNTLDYYEIGDIEKGNQLLKELAEDNCQMLKYIY